MVGCLHVSIKLEYKVVTLFILVVWIPYDSLDRDSGVLQKLPDMYITAVHA